MSSVTSSRFFGRRTRRQLVVTCSALEEQRDRAVGKQRADRDWLVGWLTRRADDFEAEAGELTRRHPSGWQRDVDHATRMASELRDAERSLIVDLTEAKE
jgi:hypothetical protein